MFAIAITLLVLTIPVPNVPDDNQQLLEALRGLGPYLGGFALSFVLVGVQWMIHHRLMREVARVTRPLMWFNLLALFGICLVPFATSLLVRYGDTPTGVITYATLQLGISLSYFVLRYFLAGRGTGSRTSALFGLVQMSGFAVSIPVALFGVNLAYACWLGGFALARTLDGWAHLSER